MAASDGWSALRISGDEVEGYRTFRAMADAADLVVIGRFQRFEPGRAIQGDATDDVVRMVDGTFEVEQAVKGEEARTIDIELLTGAGSMAQANEAAAGLEKVTAADPVVLFLRKKRGRGDDGLLRLVNSYGLVAATDRAGVDTPLGEVPERRGDADGVSEVVAARWTWRTMGDFIADLR